MSKNPLSMLIAAALFGAGTIASAQSTSVDVDTEIEAAQETTGEADVPVDDLSVQAESSTEMGFESDAVAEADIDADGDIDVDVDGEVDADLDADVADTDVANVELEPEADTAVVDAAVIDADVEADRQAIAEAEATSDTAAAVDAEGTDSLAASEPVDASDIESGEPKDAFAPTAGTQGFSAGETAQEAQQEFAELDADSNGMLGSEEVAGQASLASAFDEYDINNDGSIAENEFQSWLAATGEQATDDGMRTAQADSEWGQDATAASTEPETDQSVLAGTDTEATAQTDADAEVESDMTAQTDESELTAQDDGLATDDGSDLTDEEQADIAASDDDQE